MLYTLKLQGAHNNNNGRNGLAKDKQGHPIVVCTPKEVCWSDDLDPFRDRWLDVSRGWV